MWPVHALAGEQTRSIFDETIAFCSTLRGGQDKYFLVRSDHSSRHGEFYRLAGRSNVNLFMYLMGQVYRDIPGCGKSLAAKYGAPKAGKAFKPQFYQDDTEYKLDHFAIPLMMLDYIRGINIHDGTVEVPYASLRETSSGSFGQMPGFNLVGRNLNSDNGTDQQSNGWHRETLEPRGPGRLYTLSELALVLYNTATVRLVSLGDEPVFQHVSGQRNDGNVVRRIVSNEHPRYAAWKGRQYGPEDVGKEFSFVEVGMLPELFSVAQGFHQIHPKQSLRLLAGGQGYRNGFDEVRGLRVNGVPLQLWGNTDQGA